MAMLGQCGWNESTGYRILDFVQFYLPGVCRYTVTAPRNDTAPVLHNDPVPRAGYLASVRRMFILPSGCLRCPT